MSQNNSPRNRDYKAEQKNRLKEKAFAEQEEIRRLAAEARAAVFAEAGEVDPALPPPPPAPDPFVVWLQSAEGQMASDPRLPTDRIGLEIALEDALRKAFNAGRIASI